MSDKWIACSERLPDRNHSGDYIIAYTDANSEEAIVDRGYWRGDFWQEECNASLKVTHWQPMPDPPPYGSAYFICSKHEHWKFLWAADRIEKLEAELAELAELQARIEALEAANNALHTMLDDYRTDNALDSLHARIATQQARIQAAIEVYAGMEGFIPETAAEGYCLRIIEQMNKALQETNRE